MDPGNRSPKEAFPDSEYPRSPIAGYLQSLPLRPFLLPFKTTAGPAAPSGEPRAVWEGWMHPAAASS